MTLLKTAMIGVLGYTGYKLYKARKDTQDDIQNEAFAKGQAGGENFAQIRDAGPEAMADPSKREWTKVDEAIDESFPASDPPGNY